MSPSATANRDLSAVYQIVVPAAYHNRVLCVAHESPWAGHLGMNKTYQVILGHFFWPGLQCIPPGNPRRTEAMAQGVKVYAMQILPGNWEKLG